MAMKLLVTFLVCLASMPFMSSAKVEPFDLALGDTAFRLAIAQFNPRHSRKFTYFNQEHMFMLELLKQLGQKVPLSDYPLYASEKRYKTLIFQSSKPKSDSDYQQALTQIKKLFRSCPQESESIRKRNNYSSSLQRLKIKNIHYRPTIVTKNNKCSPEITQLFINYQLEGLAVEVRSLGNSNDEVAEILVHSQIPQDLWFIQKTLQESPALAFLARHLIPYPLVRQTDYYENFLKIIVRDENQTLADPIFLLLEKRVQRQGQIQISQIKVEARSPDGGKTFNIQLVPSPFW